MSKRLEDLTPEELEMIKGWEIEPNEENDDTFLYGEEEVVDKA